MSALDETIDSPNVDTCLINYKRTTGAITSIQPSKYALEVNLHIPTCRFSQMSLLCRRYH